MTKRIKMYNHTYKLTKRLLTEDPKISLVYLVICVINQLSPKYNYSKEGLRWAWQDFHKPTNLNLEWFDDFKNFPYSKNEDYIKILQTKLHTDNFMKQYMGSFTTDLAKPGSEMTACEIMTTRRNILKHRPHTIIIDDIQDD
jgi:hypothetical protein